MNSVKAPNPLYNWHLSAMKITREVIQVLEERFQFGRDQFANNTHCERTAYHGTFKGAQKDMTREYWDQIVAFLAGHDAFEGDLEEEIILPQYIAHFQQEGEGAFPMQSIARKKIEPCPSGIYKACDIHLKVYWNETAPFVQAELDRLEMISFDRPQKGHVLSEDQFLRYFAGRGITLSAMLVR